MSLSCCCWLWRWRWWRWWRWCLSLLGPGSPPVCVHLACLSEIFEVKKTVEQLKLTVIEPEQNPAGIPCFLTKIKNSIHTNQIIFESSIWVLLLSYFFNNQNYLSSAAALAGGHLDKVTSQEHSVSLSATSSG